MIVLINPPGFKSLTGLQTHEPNPPLGLAYIAGALKAAGLRSMVIDAAGEALSTIRPYALRPDFLVQGYSPEEIAERVPAGTRIIGITCLFSSNWPLTRDIAGTLRRRFPDALLVLGGEHGTALPEHVLKTSDFDVVILGEGEETAVALFSAFLAGKPHQHLPGIAYRSADGIRSNGLAPRATEIDAIPLPDWDSFPIREYIDSGQMNGLNMGRSMPILATRGCPYDCTFCSNPNMWTRRYITRSPACVVDEIESYVKRYKITNVDFQDLTAVVKRSWAIEFSKAMIDRGLNVTWQMPSGTRSEVFDAEVADWLFRSGCRALSFAPESGSSSMLAAIKKQVDLDHMLTSMRVAVRRGFSLSCFIVIGFPNETSQTLRETMRLIRWMAVLGVDEVAVGKFVPYPGSELFRELLAENKVSLSDDFFISPMDIFSRRAPSFARAISARRLYWTMMWMYANFFAISFLLRPLRALRIVAKAVFRGQEESRYAKWIVDRVFRRRHWRKMAGQRHNPHPVAHLRPAER